MRDYGKVYGTFWSSPTTASMSDDAKLLALYLMTCQHNTIAGAFRLPDGYVAEDLSWTAARVAQGFAELFAKGFATRCEGTKWVWIVKHLCWNKPENPNQVKSAAKVAQSIPDECGWKPEFMRVCGVSLGLAEAPKQKPLRKGSRTVAKPETGTGTGTEVKDSFDVFWSAYPNKVGKDAARKAFEAKNPPLAVALAAIAAQKASARWTRDAGQYIPNPATWLNQGRWQDESGAVKTDDVFAGAV